VLSVTTFWSFLREFSPLEVCGDENNRVPLSGEIPSKERIKAEITAWMGEQKKYVRAGCHSGAAARVRSEILEKAETSFFHDKRGVYPNFSQLLSLRLFALLTCSNLFI